MNVTIWKYQLNAALDTVDVDMPAGAQLLSAAVQGGAPCVWALVDPKQESATRRFRVLPTGGEPVDIAELGTHVGTVQLSLVPPLVFHIFDAGEVTP